MTRYEVGRDPHARSRWAVIDTRDGRSASCLFRTKSQAAAVCAEMNQTLANGHLVRTFVHQRVSIGSPDEVAQLLREWFDGFDREAMCAIFLSAKANVLGLEAVHVGALSSCLVDPGTIYRRALINNAASIIVAHNHPSGDPTPSPEDINVTKRMIEAGEMIGVRCLDHVVIGNPRFMSLREMGYF